MSVCVCVLPVLGCVCVCVCLKDKVGYNVLDVS